MDCPITKVLHWLRLRKEPEGADTPLTCARGQPPDQPLPVNENGVEVYSAVLLEERRKPKLLLVENGDMTWLPEYDG